MRRLYSQQPSARPCVPRDQAWLADPPPAARLVSLETRYPPSTRPSPCSSGAGKPSQLQPTRVSSGACTSYPPGRVSSGAPPSPSTPIQGRSRLLPGEVSPSKAYRLISDWRRAPRRCTATGGARGAAASHPREAQPARRMPAPVRCRHPSRRLRAARRAPPWGGARRLAAGGVGGEGREEGADDAAGCDRRAARRG